MSPSSPGSQQSTDLGSSVRFGCQGSWHLPGDGSPSTAGKTGNLEDGRTWHPQLAFPNLSYPVFPRGQLSSEMGLPGLGINTHTNVNTQGESRTQHTRSPGTQALIHALCLPATEAWPSYFLFLDLSFLVCSVRGMTPALPRLLKSSDSQMAL